VSKTPEEAQIIHTARKVNDGKPDWVINKVKLAIAEFLQANPDKTAREVTVACYGLAFKPDIDDLRESPAMAITQKIADMHAGRVIAVEPNIDEVPEKLKHVELMDFEVAPKEADIQVLLVDHKEFKENSVSSGIVIDSKGIW